MEDESETHLKKSETLKEDESRSIDIANSATIDLMTLNKKIVNLRAIVKRTRMLLVNNLTRNIANLKKKKGTEEEKKKNLEKAQRYLHEIESMRILKDDKITKYSLANMSSFEEVAKATISSGARALARFADHKLMKDAVSQFREEHSDWRDLVAFLLIQQTGRKFKLSTNRKKKTVTRMENINASRLMTEAYNEGLFREEGSELTRGKSENKNKSNSEMGKSEKKNENKGKLKAVEQSNEIDNQFDKKELKKMKSSKRKDENKSEAELNSVVELATTVTNEIDTSNESLDNKDAQKFKKRQTTNKNEEVSRLKSFDQSSNNPVDSREFIDKGRVTKKGLKGFEKVRLKKIDRKIEIKDKGEEVDSNAKVREKSKEQIDSEDDKMSIDEEESQDDETEDEFYSAEKNSEEDEKDSEEEKDINDEEEKDITNQDEYSEEEDFEEENREKEDSKGNQVNTNEPKLVASEPFLKIRKRDKECVVKQLKIGSDESGNDTDNLVSDSDETDEEEITKDAENNSEQANVDQGKNLSKRSLKKRNNVPSFLMKSEEHPYRLPFDPFFEGEEMEEEDFVEEKGDSNENNNQDMDFEIHEKYSGNKKLTKSLFYKPGKKGYDGSRDGSARVIDKKSRGGSGRGSFGEDKGGFQSSGRGEYSGRGRGSFGEARGGFQSSGRGEYSGRGRGSFGESSAQRTKFGEGRGRGTSQSGRTENSLSKGSPLSGSRQTKTSLPEKLHPSWEASRKRKAQETGGIKAFSGTKITFSDD